MANREQRGNKEKKKPKADKNKKQPFGGKMPMPGSGQATQVSQIGQNQPGGKKF